MNHRFSPPAAYTLSHVVAGTLLLGLMAWIAQRSGLDMAIARALYDPRSGQFPLRHSALLEFAGHRLLLVLPVGAALLALARSAEHTSELQSLMRISYAVFCLKKKKQVTTQKV